jgi:leader peptidase (prepilin peptidase)/N-methyltransferase
MNGGIDLGGDPWLVALVVALAVVGAIWGLVADRISARWPAHEDASVRRVDWRTVVVVVFGAAALAAVAVRFGDAAQRALFGAIFAMLTLQMATDLDQRLLPNLLTIPVIAVAVVALVWGGNTLVNRQPAWLAVGVAIALPLLLYALSKPFGEGAFGEGDVMYLVGAGLILGAVRLVLAVFVAAILSGVVVVALLATRRVTLRSFVPMGPFLIVGTVWVAMLPAAS